MTKQMNNTEKFNAIESDNIEILQRLCDLQKEFKELYEEGDKILIGVSSIGVHITPKQFFLMFNEYDLKPFDSEYIEANVEYEGVKFITLIGIVEKDG